MILLLILLMCVPAWGMNSRHEYKDYSRDSSCVGMWRFNSDTADMAIDQSSYGHNGALLGNPSYIKGVEDTCWQYDGSGDAFIIYNSDGSGHTLDITGDFTICGWIYPTELNSGIYYTILSKRDAGDYQYQFRIFVNDLSLLNTSGSVTSASNLSLNTWQFIAVVYDANGNTTFYELTKDYKYSAASKGISYKSINVCIGRLEVDSQGFKGKIDELAFFTRVLTLEELRYIYKFGLK